MKSVGNLSSTDSINRPELKVIVFDKDKFRGYSVISEDKLEARKILFNKVKDLIKETYDNYRFMITEDTPHLLVGVIDKKDRTLAGITMLMRYNCRGLEYGEVGVSIVKKEYRGLGIQSLCMRELYSQIALILNNGTPLIAAPRAFSAHSQLQAYNVKMPNAEGKNVRISIPGGFLLFYIVEKDTNGAYVLENDMIFTAWPTLDQIVVKDVYLPPRVLEKGFYIFNPKYRLDTRPYFFSPYFSTTGELKIQSLECKYEDDFIVYPENDYLQKKWNILPSHLSIIGHEANQKHIKKSKSNLFSYSDEGSPNRKERLIHIEAVNSFHFMDDFDSSMKVITICLQLSDMPDDLTKAANTALIDLLIKSGFVPTAHFDLLYHKIRTRVGYFTKWKDIPLEMKYEILSPFKSTFEIFNHDVQIQGLGWSKFVNIIEPEGVWALKSDDAVKQESAYTLENYFGSIGKGANSYNQSPRSTHIQFPIADTPFYKPLKEYLDHTNRIAYAIFTNEINILDHKINSDIEKILEKIPEYMSKFNLEPLEVAILAFRQQNVVLKVVVFKKGTYSIVDLRFSSILG